MDNAPRGTATAEAKTPMRAICALAAIRSPGLASTTGSRLDRLIPNSRDSTSITKASGKSRKLSSQIAMMSATMARRKVLNTSPPR